MTDAAAELIETIKRLDGIGRPDLLTAVGNAADGALRAGGLTPLSAVVLTPEDRIMAERTGTSLVALRAYKAKEEDKAAALKALADDEIRMCHSSGVDPQAYLRRKMDLARADETLARAPEMVRLSVMASNGNDKLRAATDLRASGYR